MFKEHGVCPMLPQTLFKILASKEIINYCSEDVQVFNL